MNCRKKIVILVKRRKMNEGKEVKIMCPEQAWKSDGEVAVLMK